MVCVLCRAPPPSAGNSFECKIKVPSEQSVIMFCSQLVGRTLESPRVAHELRDTDISPVETAPALPWVPFSQALPSPREKQGAGQLTSVFLFVLGA